MTNKGVKGAARGTMPTQQENKWRVSHEGSGGSGSWEGPLVAHWEVELDPMSGDYLPDEISAQELLDKWAALVRERHPDGLIPIYWYVSSLEAQKLEAMPFQYDQFQGKKKGDSFLSFYGWPVHVVTGEPLNWLTLPVADKLWNKRHADGGGFIQEATGWKPSILQPHVYLSALLRATGD